MKIVFVGSVTFSERALIKLFQLKANIVGIIAKETSTLNSDFVDISYLASKFGIPWKYVRDINHPNNIEWIKAQSPDIIFCFGWSSLIKKELLDLPRHGIIGYHPALLPQNRGRHPLIWAKVLGLKETGSTFFFMDEGTDTGDILVQKKIEICFEDTADRLYQKMIDTALIQIEEFLPMLRCGTFSRIPQNREIGNTWRKRSMLDGKIDFRMTSEAIVNLVRGISRPYVGAHIEYQGQEVKIWNLEIGKCLQKNIEPGKVIVVTEDYIEVKTGNGSVLITNHEFKNLPVVGTYFI